MTVAARRPTDTPMTAGQRSLWLLDRLEPTWSAYHVAFAARVEGGINPSALRRAVERLALRHSALRTTFTEEGGQPRARLHDHLPPDFEHGSAASPDEADARALAFHQRPFDLASGPLFRVGLFERGIGEAILVVTAHHVVADFQSLEIVMVELESLYRAEREGTETELPDARPFSRHAEEEDAYLRGARANEDRAYWVRRLARPPEHLDWTWPVPPELSAQPGAGNTHRIAVGADVSAALVHVARELRATPYTVLLSVLSELVARWTDRRDLIIGAPSTTRGPEDGNMIGHFVNPVALRVAPAAGLTLRQLVASTQRSVLEGVEHRLFPLARIVDAVKPHREAGRTPLYQVMLGLQQPTRFRAWADLYLADAGSPGRADWAGLTLRPHPLPQQAGQMDLALEVVQARLGFCCELRSRADRLPLAALSTMAGQLQRLLELALAHPDRLLSALDLQDPSAVAARSSALNRFSKLPPPTDDLVRRFAEVARRKRGSPAIVDGDLTLDYGALDERSAAVASVLRTGGVRRGDRVGTCLPPSADAVVAMLGVLRAGAAYVPIDLKLPAGRVGHMVALSGLRQALVAPDDAGLLPPGVRAVAVDQSPGHAEIPPPPGPSAGAYTLFTSGSTGQPKGIHVSHGSVVALLDAVARVVETGADDTWAWFHAASFDLSAWEIWGALLAGGRLAIVPEDVRGRPDAFVTLLERHTVTVTVQTPSALRLLGAELERRGRAPGSLRLVVSCGEALPGAVASHVVGRGFAVWNMYGPAEATVFTTGRRVDAAAAAWEVVPLGAALGHVRVHLLDDRGHPAPAERPGEIWISGPGLALGYAGNPDATRDRFVTLPGIGRCFRTGDLASWDGADLHFCGRRDNQVKIRGFRVELGDIEAALQGIPEVAAVGVVLQRRPDGDQLVAAVVLADPDEPAAEAALRAAAARLVPSYMIPGRFVAVPSVPLSLHGKLDRRAIIALLEQTGAGSVAPARYPETGDAIEDAVAGAWAAVLSRPDVPLDVSFFEAGGDSLALMRVYARLSQLPEARGLRPTDLFRYPTVHDLARRIREGSHPIAQQWMTP